MKRITVSAILASCVLALALVGCSGSGQGAAQSASEDDLKGFWQIEEPSQVGFEAVLNLEDEGLAELMVADGFLEGTWSTDGTNAQIEFSSSDAWDMEGDGIEVIEESDKEASASAEAASSEAAASSDAASTESEEAPKIAKIAVSDGKLILGSSEGSKLVFVKGNIDEYFGAEGSAGDVTGFEDAEGEVIDPVIEEMKTVAIADNDTVAIHVTGKGTDYLGDPCYRLSITNKTKKAIDVESSDDMFKVGGQEAEGILGEIVEAGETLETYLSFAKDEISGVDKLTDVSGTIVVSDDDSGDEIATYDFEV